MRTVLILMICFAISRHVAAEPVSYVTVVVNGSTFSNVTWGTVTPATVVLYHRGGVETVALSALPAKWQTEFKYDPALADGFRAQQQLKREAAGPRLDCPATRAAFDEAVGIHETMSFESEITFNHPGPEW